MAPDSTTGRRSETEIEITPEMIAAGVDVVDYDPLLPADELVRNILRASLRGALRFSSVEVDSI